MPLFEQATWHALGLSVAASYAGLGCFSTLLPRTAANMLFNLGDTPMPPRNQTAKLRSAPQTQDDARVVPLLMPLLGARDLSIAAALFALGWSGKTREMGTVILGGMILCVVDVAVVWKEKGLAFGAFFAAGASVWAAIGLGLQFDDF